MVSDASGFFVLDEVPDCETLWMLATGTAIGPYLSILQYGQDVARFKNLVLVHAARFAADLSYLPLMLELQQRYEGKAAHPNGGQPGERARLAYRTRASAH